MNSILVLLVSAFVAIHQYLPNNDPQFQKYYNDAREVKESQIFPAANQSCRYIYSVLAETGVQVGLGNAGGEAFSSLLADLVKSEDGFQSVLSMVDSPTVAEKLAGKDLSAEEIKSFLQRLCSEDFNPLSFLPRERQQVYNFIKEDIEILSDESLNSLGDFVNFGTTTIYDRNEKVIGKIGSEHRQWVPYNELASTLPLTLLATEDRGFFEHSGVNAKSIARMATEVTSSSRVTGGSTITMQLLKNMFFASGPESKIEELNSGSTQMLLRKVREWFWALPLEKNFSATAKDPKSKEKIMELYFNLVSFGPNIQGIGQASQVYFNKKPKDLSLAESAFIASLLKAPSRYSNPSNYAEDTFPRRNNIVLSPIPNICEEASANRNTSEASGLIYRMCRNPEGGVYNSEYIESILESPLPNWQREEPAEFHPSFYSLKNYINRWMPRQFKAQTQALKQLDIKTSIDSELQKVVFDVVRKKIDQYDRARNYLELVEPARDDRGRQARIRREDVGYLFEYQINRLTQRASSQEKVYLINIYLGVQGDDGRISLQSEDIITALQTVDYPNHKREDITREILKEVKAQSNRLGESKFVTITKEGYELVSLDDLLSEIEIDDETREEIQNDFSRSSISARLAENSLNRLYRYRHRSSLEPALLLDTGVIIGRGGKNIKLFKSHRRRISRKFSRAGYFFWVRTQDNTIAVPTYSLDAPRLQASAIVIDTQTGAILANFGGYDPERSAFDRSLRGMRQPGSTVKPWLYFSALNRNFRLNDILDNRYTAVAINDGRSLYSPKNYSSLVPWKVTLSQGLVNSYNVATFNLIKDTRWGNEGRWWENLQDVRGIFEHTGIYDESMNRPSIMLGAQETTLERMTRSFSFFSNGQSLVETFFIDEVVDFQGSPLFQWDNKRKLVPLMRYESIEEIQSLLLEVANTGTARRLNYFTQNLESQGKLRGCFNRAIGYGKQTCFGGKTGTTNDGRDAWFIGISKRFAIGVWVGYDEFRAIPKPATGGDLALPIFQEIIKEGVAFLPEIEPLLGNKIPEQPSVEDVVENILSSVVNEEDQPSSEDPSTSLLEAANEIPSSAADAITNILETVVDEPAPQPQAAAPVTTPQPSSLACACVPQLNSSGSSNFYVQVTYPDGRNFLSQNSFHSQSDCQSVLPTTSIEGVRVCR